MKLTAVGILFFALAAVAHADSWIKAQPTGVVSSDGRLVVRIIPGSSMGEVYGFAGEPKSEHAVAMYYRLEDDDKFVFFKRISLMNPIAPVFSAVANSGELVTLDNWHNFGIGKVITIYTTQGTVLRSFGLADIYLPKEIETLSSSVSSIMWRCNTPPVLREGSEPTLMFLDRLGNVIKLNIRLGSIGKAGSHKGC